MNAPIRNSIADMIPELIAFRRDLHRHPELMYDLPRTSGRVAEQLRAIGVDDVIEGMGRTGVLAVLHGANGPANDKSRTVLFRADMDALPILEESGADHASMTPGHMHACGHDGHTTMLLGAVRCLAQNRDFDGTLIFCFQPAEEGGAGAKAMIEDGMLERFPVKSAYALHNWPGLPAGDFAVVRGPVMAAAASYDIVVDGYGGHAAMPHRTRDPIVAAAHLITAAQTVVSRVVDPLEPAVVSITSVNGGDAYNVIPGKVTLRANTRCYSEFVGQLMEAELTRLCSEIGQAFGVDARLSRKPGTPYPPTINHPAESELALSVMRSIVGEARVHADLKPSMAAEDFAFILQRTPGAYVWIGNGDSAPVHHPAYDFNDEIIGQGVAFWVELAARTLPRSS